MRFVTATGSVYEVNLEEKKMRRLSGKKDPSPRQGKDGEWKSYLGELRIEIGHPVLISWADSHPVMEETADLFRMMGAEVPEPAPGRNTITSPVAEIES